MTKDEKDAAWAALHDFQAAFKKIQDEQQKWQEAEKARRAKLTLAQRAEEDRAKAEQLACAERQKLTQKLAKLGDAVMKRDTWTIEKFSWLLAAENPEDDSWMLFDGRSGRPSQLQKQFRQILESCVDTRLKAVNPHEAPALHRFTVQSLIEVAQEKRLGCFEVLADMVARRTLAHRPGSGSSAATTPPTTAPQVKPSPEISKAPHRETQKKRRQKDLVSFARSLAEAGDGSVRKDSIALSILGVELNRRFRQTFPEWKNVSDKTLEEDRPSCHPRIAVSRGRPRGPQDEF